MRGENYTKGRNLNMKESGLYVLKNPHPLQISNDVKIKKQFWAEINLGQCQQTIVQSMWQTNNVIFKTFVKFS